MGSPLTKLIAPRFSINALEDYRPNLPVERTAHLQQIKNKLQSDYQLTEETCICGAFKDLVIAEYDRYGIPLTQVLCMDCGTIRVNPYLNEYSIGDFYSHHYQQLYGRSIDKAAYFSRQKQYGAKYYSIVRTFLSPHDWIFEVGCGAGGGLSFFQKKGFQTAGCDFDQPLLDYGRQQGLSHLIYGSIQDLKAQLSGQKATLIFLNHVFEHVLQPKELLKACQENLADGGQIILAVPDIEGIQLNDAYQGNLLSMFHIAHKYNYSMAGIQKIAAEAGLKARLIFPDSKLKTHTSNMGEMWIKLKKSNEMTPLNSSVRAEEGWHRYHKLVQHESLYQKHQRLAIFKLKKYHPVTVLRKMGSKIKNVLSHPS